MALFADYFTVKLGDTVVKGRRLTLKEIRENAAAFLSGQLDIETSVKLIESHCQLESGDKFDALELSESQLRTLIGELVLPEKGRQVSDFIGLFS